MKARTILWMLLAGLPIITFAQNDDDMYFVPKKKSKTTEVQTAQESNRVAAGSHNTVRRATEEYYTGPLRDVDEYNRRGASYLTIVAEDDTILVDKNSLIQTEDGKYILPAADPETLYGNDDEDYTYSIRLSRFHGIGYPYSWYDPWYYDSFYYDPWYYGYHGWGWYGGWHGYYGWYNPWYNPWHYGWGWGWGPGWSHGWHHPHGSLAGGGTPRRGFNGGRGYAMTGSSSRGQATRNGVGGRMGNSTYRSSNVGVRNERTTGRTTTTTTNRSNSTVRGIQNSSSRSTVNSSSSRGTSTSRTTSSPSMSGGSRGSVGSSPMGGSSMGGSRGGGFSGGGSSRGGGRR